MRKQLLLALVVLTFASLAVHGQSQTDSVNRQRIHHQAVRPTVPEWIVTLQPTQIDPADVATRAARGRSHNLAGAFQTVDELPVNEGLLRLGGSSDFLPHSATPTAQSDLIVSGQVVAGSSFLSLDRRNIYSEAYLKPDNLLKGSSSLGNLLDIQQDGGTVRLDSGRIIRKLPIGGTYPLDLGKRYLLFLRSVPDTRDFAVVGVWDVSSDVVHQLAPSGQRIASTDAGELFSSKAALMAAVQVEMSKEASK